MYASRIEGKWNSEIIDSGCPFKPSLAFDSNDNLYIGYCNSNGLRLATTVNIFNNQPPDAPTIEGKTSGKVGKEYEYRFITIDPDMNNISLYIINWDDGTQDIIDCSIGSGKEFIAVHDWNKTGIYTIKARAKDNHSLWSPWSELEVNIPRTRAASYHWLLERFPMLDRLLGWIRN
jgi:hypothetical protein